ncbi:MAG: hypothetical protein V4444_02415 [Pseudomonadota bacterium]
MHLVRAGALAAVAAAALVAAVPAAAQGSYSPYNETATAALARYVRAIAADPKDFASLVAAGRAALELGDVQAAAGFFARADEVNPKSWQPQAGMGAVSVGNGEAQAALPYFTRAQQLGATAANFGADRGLAYDLLGRLGEAQADYRSALAGPDKDLARARLALSMAISGNRAGALETLGPLVAKGDPAGARARAFVLALTGDPSGARVAIDLAMPGSSSSLAPFLSRLSGLSAGQKAAAVNLGMFPDAGELNYAYAAANHPPMAPAPALQQAAPPMVSASIPAPRASSIQKSSAAARKLWLELGSSENAEALNTQFAKMRSRNEDLFDGIHGYVARGSDRSRLLIGPFRNASDADTFAADLESVNVNAKKWSNSDSDLIVPLGTN